jgi:hypothetical protein
MTLLDLELSACGFAEHMKKSVLAVSGMNKGCEKKYKPKQAWGTYL